MSDEEQSKKNALNNSRWNAQTRRSSHKISWQSSSPTSAFPTIQIGDFFAGSGGTIMTLPSNKRLVELRLAGKPKPDLSMWRRGPCISFLLRRNYISPVHPPCLTALIFHITFHKADNLPTVIIDCCESYPASILRVLLISILTIRCEPRISEANNFGLPTPGELSIRTTRSIHRREPLQNSRALYGKL